MTEILNVIKRNVCVLGLQGFLKMIYSCLYKVCVNVSPKASAFFLKKRDEILFRYINRLYRERDKVSLQTPKKECENTIWVFWWQGEDKAPSIIQYCINSIRKHCVGWKVTIISKDNISNYLSLPAFITDKVGQGISFVQLSDIVRVSLVSTYGGGWIDAGMLMTGDIPSSISKYTYFTIKNSYRPSSLVSQYRWTGSFMFGHANNPIATNMYKLFILYWSKNKYLTEYFLIDYLEAFLYNNNKECKDFPANVNFRITA